VEPITREGIDGYAEAHTTAPVSLLRELAEETNRRPDAQMMVGPLEGRFLEMLVFAVRPRLVVEIGAFTGYSALSMAAGLPPDGRIVSCDINEETTAIARRYVERSPYAGRIEFRLGPALETLASLDGPFDFVFIDADKTSYLDYFEAALPKLAEHGLIAVDNTLWSGRVLDPADTSDDTDALRRFNDHVAADPRVVCVQTTVRDGVTLLRTSVEA
jgi:caffeoyl-CoA O-methyltransferase